MSKTITQNATPPTPIIDSPTDWVRKHINTYVATDGADGHNYKGVMSMLLTTQGRKTGAWNRSALFYGSDGDDVILIASNGGAPKHPLWYENLVQNAQVWVQVGSDKYWATAIVTDPQDPLSQHSRLWALMCEVWPAYNEYHVTADAVGRIIPLVILRRN